MMLNKGFLYLVIGCLITELALASVERVNNIYDAKGNLVASCQQQSACQYMLYAGVRQIAKVKHASYQKNFYDPDQNNKIALIDTDQEDRKTVELLVTDFHGTVVAKVTEEGMQTYQYDAFGNSLNRAKDCEGLIYMDKAAISCNHYDFNARFYDNFIGRFTETDSVIPDHGNWYTFVKNNPLKYVDPDGKEEKEMHYANRQEAEEAYKGHLEAAQRAGSEAIKLRSEARELREQAQREKPAENPIGNPADDAAARTARERYAAEAGPRVAEKQRRADELDRQAEGVESEQLHHKKQGQQAYRQAYRHEFNEKDPRPFPEGGGFWEAAGRFMIILIPCPSCWDQYLNKGNPNYNNGT